MHYAGDTQHWYLASICCTHQVDQGCFVNMEPLETKQTTGSQVPLLCFTKEPQQSVMMCHFC